MLVSDNTLICKSNGTGENDVSDVLVFHNFKLTSTVKILYVDFFRLKFCETAPSSHSKIGKKCYTSRVLQFQMFLSLGVAFSNLWWRQVF